MELQGIANGHCIFEDQGEVIDLWSEDREAEHEGSKAKISCEDASDASDEERGDN